MASSWVAEANAQEKREHEQVIEKAGGLSLDSGNDGGDVIQSTPRSAQFGRGGSASSFGRGLSTGGRGGGVSTFGGHSNSSTTAVTGGFPTDGFGRPSQSSNTRGSSSSTGFNSRGRGSFGGAVAQNSSHMNEEMSIGTWNGPPSETASWGPPAAEQATAIETVKSFWSAQKTPSTFDHPPPQPRIAPVSVIQNQTGGFSPATGYGTATRGQSKNRGLSPRGRGAMNSDRGRPITGASYGGNQNMSRVSGGVEMAGSIANTHRHQSQEAGGEEAPNWYGAATTEATTDDDDKPMAKEEISLLNKLLHQKIDNLQTGSVEISRQQADPTSPLYSVATFESLRLKDELLRALQVMGFQQPSKIQEAALPILLVEPPQNMIAQSQSGTGKTAAFVLTMLSRVVAENKWPQCLCLAPTYELATQIGQVVKEMSQFMPTVKMRYAIRGELVNRGTMLSEQIIIGTPGKMLDWMLKYRCIDPARIVCFVLDEADVMISQQGHQDLSVRIKNEIERANANCQCLLFSATYDEQIFQFAESIVPDPMIITLRREEQTLANIKQFYVECANREQKYQAVLNLYSGLTIGSAIIFCHTRKAAAWLAERLRERRHAVVLLSGELEIEERARVIKEFKEGQHKVLVTTNVCARGIDVSQVTIVVNYDPPVTTDRRPDFETYLHRIGRTGRFGKAGIAINFVDDDYTKGIIEQIQQHFGRPIELLDTSDIEQLEAIEKD